MDVAWCKEELGAEMMVVGDVVDAVVAVMKRIGRVDWMDGRGRGRGGDGERASTCPCECGRVAQPG